jgi:hypothetical protein
MEVIREEDGQAWWTDDSVSGKKHKKKSEDSGVKNKVKVRLPIVLVFGGY